MSKLATKFTKQTHPLAIARPANDAPSILSDIFYRLFDLVIAKTPQQLEQVYRLRYQVFCVEKEGFEDPSCHPKGQETDDYDSHAKHALLSYKPTGEALGTIRVILPHYESLHESFPIQTLCNIPELRNEFHIRNSCEASRFCISLTARKQIKRDLEGTTAQNPSQAQFVRKALTLAPLGLISGIFQIALQNQKINCYAVMEPPDLNKLVRMGLRHQRITEDINFHGRRTPFTMNILDTLNYILHTQPHIWHLISKGGEYHAMAERLTPKHSHIPNDRRLTLM